MHPVCTIVSYDVADPKRLRRVFEICRSFGDHLQLSVFRADLTPRSRAELIAELDAVIDHRADQVLLVDVGPSEGRARKAFRALGRPYTRHELRATIV
ncbi:MAG: CRISPR-associated endonuclease Cas2 [Candidatus Schekmanbacteria bacterium]|nr:CRISPR-associated endonuclease Cas2 [Candidatus Schekmanbacteria bacterium]